MAEIKTKPTEISVDTFIEAVEHPVRRADAKVVRGMMERLTECPATMWGPSIIGFGSYHYKYDSGHEGDMCRIGFSPRKAQLVLYLGSHPGQEAMLARFGKYKRGKACIYVNKLTDIDLQVLEELIEGSFRSADITTC